MTSDSDIQPEAGVPSDVGAAGVLRRLAEEGFDAQFVPGAEPATLRCVASGSTTAAEGFEVDDERRLEGASDPDDMVLVVAAACPVCGAKGAVVLGYGPEASEVDTDLVQALASS